MELKRLRGDQSPKNESVKRADGNMEQLFQQARESVQRKHADEGRRCSFASVSFFGGIELQRLTVEQDGHDTSSSALCGEELSESQFPVVSNID